MSQPAGRRVLIAEPLDLPPLPPGWSKQVITPDEIGTATSRDLILLGAAREDLDQLVARIPAGLVIVVGDLPPARAAALWDLGVTDFAAGPGAQLDATLRRVFAAQSAAAGGRLGDLAREIGNDLGNAMTAVLGYTQLVADGGGPPLAEDVDELRGAANRAGQLTSQLLNLVNSWPNASSVTDLRSVLEAHAAPIDRLYEGGLDIRLTDTPAPVGIRPGRLLEGTLDMLDALTPIAGGAGLTLALRAGIAPQPTRLTVQALSTSGDAALEQQLASAERGAHGPLHLAASLARDVGGRLRIERRGRQLTLALELPPVGGDSNRSTPPAAGNGHLLLAEDDAMIRKLTARALRTAGFVVLEAASAEEGLAMVEETPVVAVVSDVRLAGVLNGIDLIETLRKRFAHLPAVLTTGAGTLPVGSSLPAGTPVLFKPYTRDAIRSTVLSVCQVGE